MSEDGHIVIRGHRQRDWWIGLAAIVGLLGLRPGAASAVVVHGDTLIAASDPALVAQFSDFAWWRHTGWSGDGSVIYLDNGWVLTANHVGVGPVTIDGQTYAWDNTTPAVQLTNPDDSAADLLLFKITQTLALPPVPLRSTSPSISDTTLIVGFGREQAASTTTWDVDVGTNPWTWTTPATVPHLPNVTGYLTSDTRGNRWGTNQVQTATSEIPLGSVKIWGFETKFNANGTAYEAQPVKGDSGGTVFLKNGGTWELAGITVAITSLSGQPGGNTSAMLDYTQTLIADLSVYRQQILDVISEPAIPGDFNDDGVVNTQDINPFILALTDLAQYQATYPQVDLLGTADLNHDNLINTEDINPFIQLLTGAGASNADVPEPGVLTLIVMAAPLLARRPRR